MASHGRHLGHRASHVSCAEHRDPHRRASNRACGARPAFRALEEKGKVEPCLLRAQGFSAYDEGSMDAGEPTRTQNPPYRAHARRDHRPPGDGPDERAHPRASRPRHELRTHRRRLGLSPARPVAVRGDARVRERAPPPAPRARSQAGASFVERPAAPVPPAPPRLLAAPPRSPFAAGDEASGCAQRRGHSPAARANHQASAALEASVGPVLIRAESGYGLPGGTSQ